MSTFYQLKAAELNFNSPDRGFTSWLPGRSWDEALLSGNGTIGAMVMGRPHDETILLNHALLYLPANYPIKPIKPGNNKELKIIRSDEQPDKCLLELPGNQDVSLSISLK